MVSRLVKASRVVRRKRAFLMEKRKFNMNIFSGYKTFAVAAFLVFAAVVDGMWGVDLPYVNVGDDWLTWMLAGLGLGSVRDALRKAMDLFAGN